MSKLKEKYENLCRSASDIYEHLPTIKKYSEECEHVTEMGVRAIVSTYAIMMGQPKKIVSIDIKDPQSYGANIMEAKQIAFENDIDFNFVLGDTRTITIDETDLLFIDTWHVYEQLKIELEKHSDKSKKYIILHDTTVFGENGETGGHRGLWPAVTEFLENNKNWILHERYTNNNGLTILKRI